MITRTPAYTDSNGTPHATLELAQAAELTALLMSKNGRTGFTEPNARIVAELMLAERETICEILRATGRKPRASKKAGNGVKKRRVLKPDAHGVIDLEKAGGDK